MERILIKFTKKDSCQFISHLDLIRTLQRAMKRAGIPVSFSKGFNPHASISVAAPLSLGVSSSAEYADIEIEDSMDPGEIKVKLSNALPRGIAIIESIKVEGKMPSSAAVVEGASYELLLNHTMTADDINSVIKSILIDENIERLKKTKSGEKMVDIRPFIKDLVVKNYSSSSAAIECLLYTGSKGGVNPEIVIELIKERSKDKITGYVQIMRQELYGIRDHKWVPLDVFFTGK